MLTVLRSALLVMLTLLLALSQLGAAPPAQASPPQPTPDGASNRTSVTLSTTQWKAAKLVTKARNGAVSTAGGSMDYTKVKTIFAANKTYGTAWRRQMAAGYRQTGGKIINISKTENAKVEALRKKLYGKKRPRAGATSSFMAFGPDCTGRSGRVVINKQESHTYFNSCQTNDLVYAWAGCVAAMGAAIRWFAKKAPKVEIPAYLVGGFCTLQLGTLKRAQSNSDVKAIYVRMYQQQTYVPYPSGLRYLIQYTLESQ